MKWAKGVLLLVLGSAVFVGGYLLGGGPETPAEKKDEVWTCPMHPEIKLPEFGECPKCGMDLEILRPGMATGPRQVAMSEAEKLLAEIVTAPVTRREAALDVRMVGKVAYDETRIKTISAWFPGRLERLFVDYTGISVREGDHLVELYSPDVLTAQQELLEAVKQVGETAQDQSEFLRASAMRLLESAREKLRLLGLEDDQVKEIEERGIAEDHVLINSPLAGIVIHKARKQGEYVQTGSEIYVIADLDHLWVLLDAYESDLAWIRYGQPVVIRTEAFPGEDFDGRISFVDPVLDDRTRTVKVRVNVDNADRKLKPGMFVRATVHSTLAEGGRVMDPSLEGKWVCPMHPEVVADELTGCSVCGMPLVPAEEMFGPGASARRDPLVVPATAVLYTGLRSVVYVEVPGADLPTYEGREVVLGARAGEDYVVVSGLDEGEHVVVNGAFKIDSALQIRAKKSMMSMGGESSGLLGPQGERARQALDEVYRGYFAVQAALAGDDFEAARGALGGVRDATVAAAGAVSGEFEEPWRELHAELQRAVASAESADSIDALRVAFEPLSMIVLKLQRAVGHSGGEPHVEAHCPMAFDDKGASWLQLGSEISNPYFGASMLRCGSVEAEFGPLTSEGR